MNIELRPGHTLSGHFVTWRDADNPHLYISGQSGTGKSFLLKKLLAQAAAQNAFVIVLDSTSDFSCYTPPASLHFQRMDVASSNFSLNPLIGPPGQSPGICAQQLLAALQSVFRMGSRAIAALKQATITYLSETETPSLNGLLDRISATESTGYGLDAALEPLQLLSSLIHCGGESISLDLGTPGLTVLDFSQIIDQGLCKLLIDLILQTLWTAHGPTHPPLILILDECQRLNWGKSSMSIRILREGRKFGIAGWFSSQWVDDKEAAAALGQAAVQAHFRPDDRHIDNLAKYLCSGRSSELPQYRRLIQGIKRGQFLWQRADSKPVIVNVDS